MAGTETAGAKPLNRLAGEKSPYLLQHSGNPVDWYPWGDEAFQRARTEDRPIFLSIGYSTCHWCHVMEVESFEDEGVAAILNNDFVSIKVDREERPDIDNVYMTACQVMTGSGGWPLTIIMTPDKKPFFAGTYIPKETRFGTTGLVDLLPAVVDRWKEGREELARAADRIESAIGDEPALDLGVEPTEGALHMGFRQLASRFDEEHGGFGGGMKFPTPHQLIFLLRYWKRTGNEDALHMADHTLRAMRSGGIFDQVGYGFHRYSTEPSWLVPHFEKMLYDQALLMTAYAEAYQATGREEHSRTVREIAEYVRRELTSPEGAFYSAQDADSEGIEGKFYLWTVEEVMAALDPGSARMVLDHYGLTRKGNFDEDGVGPGANILSLGSSDGVRPTGEEAARLDAARQTLLEIRSHRAPPLLDDKILTDWNGLMLGALARASVALSDPEMAAAARTAVDFVLANLSTPNGRLLHRYRDGEAGLAAHLDDYAFMVFGLIELYRATLEERYLEAAVRLNTLMLDLFGDEKGGSLYLTARDSEPLIVRPRELFDGAVPSGNSVAVWNLLRLSRMTGDPALEAAASSVSRGYSDSVARAPAAHTMFLVALDKMIRERANAGGRRDNDSEATARNGDHNVR